MPQTTSPRRFRFVVALTCFSLLAAALGVACAQQKNSGTPVTSYTITVTCGPKTATVLASGIDPKQEPLFVCPGDKVTWKPHNALGAKRFSVEFETSPFTDGTRYCDQTDCPTLNVGANTTNNVIEVHKYSLLVDKAVFDPHVIIVPGSVPTQ
jgi:hypothetical protein